MTERKRTDVETILKRKIVKLDIGGGSHPAQGYVNVDIDDLPDVELVLDAKELEEYFPPRSIDGLMCRDTLQCFKHSEVKGVLRQWHKALKPRSKFVLQCYDMDAIVQGYVDEDLDKDHFRRLMYGSQRTEHQVFLNCFDEEYLVKILESIGFVIQDISRPPYRIKIVAIKK